MIQVTEPARAALDQALQRVDESYYIRGQAPSQPGRPISIKGSDEMNSNVRREMPERRLGLLRVASLITVLAGAVGSFGLMIHVGSRQRSLILSDFSQAGCSRRSWLSSASTWFRSAGRFVSERWSIA